MWDAPKKVRTPQQQQEHYSFEDGPVGGYDPNMSDADKERWKAKITGVKRGIPQVEIRKTMGGTMLTLIVCLEGGYTYKNYVPKTTPGYRWDDGTERFNIHLAANGPLQMTFQDMQELHDAVEEAKAKLQELAP
jgi:hypothetical protein